MRIIFFDLETGGMDGKKHAITQFASIVVNPDFSVVEELEIKIKFRPENADPEALAVNHYDQELWAAEAISPLEARRKIYAQFNRYKDRRNVSARTGKAYNVAQLAGHNAHKFDRPFLGDWWERLGKPDWCPADWRVLDTQMLAHWYCHVHGTEPENMKLETLCEFFDITVDGPAHDALVDVRMTIELAKHLTKKGG